MGLSTRAAAVRARDPGARRAAAGDPRADPLLPAGRAPSPQHVYLGEARAAPAGPRGRPITCRAMALEFAAKVRRIPVYPAADAYALEGPVAHAGLQRVALPADPGGARGGREGARRRSTAIRTRRTPRCGASSPTATACRPTGSRSATAPATSCSPPATRCSSRAPSSSTPGRRSASTRTSPPRPAPARSRSPLDAEHRHDLDAMRREITVATRLVIVCNPNNPTSTALPLDEIAAFVADVPAPRRA